MNVTLFYDQIIEYIATSKECSKIVPVICFDFSNYKNLEICGRAKEVKIGQQLINFKYTKYQILNIHNPKMRFSILMEEKRSFQKFDVHIRIMNL
nr:unnamed protein product [Meloidogyne enterolobii]